MHKHEKEPQKQVHCETSSPAHRAGTDGNLSEQALRIAVIDDDPMILDVMAQMLDFKGHRVSKFCDAEQAMKWLRTNLDQVDLILSDITMPGKVQGRHFYSEFHSKVPVVLMSGLVGGTDTGINPSHVLLKPISMTDLLTKVEAIFRESTAEQLTRHVELQ